MDAKSKILDKAQKYIQKGYLDRAIDEYRKVLNAKPGDVSTRLRVGDLFVKIGKQEDAIKEYHEAARTLTKKGFYLKAIAVYKQILKLDPPNIDIRYRLAELYTRQNLIANAIGEYDILARHFESKGKREDTLNIIKKMLEIDSENVGIRLRLAEIYEQSGFHEDAVSEYGNAAEQLIENDKYDTAEKLLNSLYDKGEKQPKVLEGFRAVAKEKGENEQFLSYSRELISLYDELGEEDKKREMCEELLELFPDDSEILAAMEGPGGEDETCSGEGETGETGEDAEGGEEEPHTPLPVSEESAAKEAGEGEEGIEGALEEEVEESLGEQEVSEEPLIPWSEMVEIEDEPESSQEPLDEVAEEVVEGTEEDVEPEPVSEEAEFESVTAEEEVIGEGAEVDAEPAVETVEELEQIDADELVEELPEEPEVIEEIDKGFLEDTTEEVIEELFEKVTEPEPLSEEAEFESVTAEEEVIGEGAEAGAELVVETVEELEQSDAEELVEELPGEPEPVEEIGEGFLEDTTEEVVEELFEEETESESVSEEAEIESVTAEEEVIGEGAEADAEPAAETVEELEQSDAEIDEEPLEDATEEVEDALEGLGDDSETPAESGYVDLSSELGLAGIEGSETVSDEFHDGLERQLNREDTETHYNMGIAYMEMEMFDEAVKEFKIALKDPNRVFDCQVRLGLSYMAKGEPQEAIACYTGGLDVTGRTDGERKGLMYELALAYETAGKDESALDFFNKVSAIDSGFRDLSGKLRRLNEKSHFLSIDDNLIEVELL